MRYYRVNSGMPYLTATQAQAKADARRLSCAWEPHDVPTDKEGLMAYLNGQENISSLDDAAIEQTPLHQPPAESKPAGSLRETDYSAWTDRLEEEWEKLPLAHQLHFAALAMERAREAIA